MWHDIPTLTDTVDHDTEALLSRSLTQMTIWTATFAAEDSDLDCKILHC